jgi:hypothetical protein
VVKLTAGEFYMAKGIYSFKHLTPEEERLLKEAEDTLGGNVLLAYTGEEIQPSDLNESQLECLQGLEQKLGVTVLAVKRA